MLTVRPNQYVLSGVIIAQFYNVFLTFAFIMSFTSVCILPRQILFVSVVQMRRMQEFVACRVTFWPASEILTLWRSDVSLGFFWLKWELVLWKDCHSVICASVLTVNFIEFHRGSMLGAGKRSKGWIQIKVLSTLPCLLSLIFGDHGQKWKMWNRHSAEN